MLIRIDSWRSKSHHCPPKDSRRLDPSFQSRPANSLINIYPDRCSIRPAFIYTQVLFHPFDNVTIVRLIEWEESLCRFFVMMEYIFWRDALDGSIASSAASFSPLPFFFSLSFYSFLSIHCFYETFLRDFSSTILCLTLEYIQCQLPEIIGSWIKLPNFLASLELLPFRMRIFDFG